MYFHFPRFSVFLTYFRSCSVHFSFFMFFNISPHISVPNECYSHFCDFQFSRHIHVLQWIFLNFPHFSVFLAIFHAQKCVFLIFRDFQFSCHILGPAVCISHFSRFSIFLLIFQYLTSVILIFVIFSFLAIFQVLQCAFLIFLVFQGFRHFSGHKVDVSHFPWFSVFLPYSMSYIGHFYIFHLFQFSLPYFTS